MGIFNSISLTSWENNVWKIYVKDNFEDLYWESEFNFLDF